ncbi:Zinc finger, CCHC-type [Ostreococcus tauri]|uniref:Zinc finger, CCHC-type n=1 Tax=Ostreococcus tauri TaxID=70448 RepID=A0A090N399_OSTTA|nr:Zinc finger, CCHC-type [Ostreococcus tauri]CEF97748.1 Zinc finger, CCHC-type [Ostreococcus tauri]|eukprot:XP_022838864.1 Zinc finger, CCHC-type [Ostreococcus tauri]
MPRGNCARCGEPGHWAKDCTAPRARANERDGMETIADGTTTTTTGPDGRTTATARRKKTARRPKFSIHEHLLGPNGLGVVYATFPEKFREASKGDGHEAADAAALVAMYKEWAVKMYPYAPAEETLERVSKLGKDKAVRAAIREFHERDFGGGVGERVAEMEREEAAARGEDVFFPDDDDVDDENAPTTAGAPDADDGIVADDVDFPDDDDGFEDLEEDYVFEEEDEDAADALREADAAGADEDVDFPDDDEDDENDDEPSGKRSKQVKGATDATKEAFAKLAKKVGKNVEEENVVRDATNVSPVRSPPRRKILRVRPKILDASSEDEDEDEPEEPARRRRAVHMDEDDEE